MSDDKVPAPPKISRFGVLAGIALYLGKFNTWIARKTGITATRIFQVEVGALLGFGLTMIQIAEYGVAVACWIMLALIGVSKTFARKGIEGSRNLTIGLKFLCSCLVLVFCVLLITITDIRRDDEPWSNLQKLWSYGSLAVTVESEVTTESGYSTGIWVLYPGPKCVISPVGAFVFMRVTNERTVPDTITSYTVESKKQGWHLFNAWQPLRQLDLRDGYTLFTIDAEGTPRGLTIGRKMNIPPLMRLKFSPEKADFKQAPIMGFDIFDAKIGGQPLSSKETVTGWSAYQYDENLGGDLRITVFDELEKSYRSIHSIEKARAMAQGDVTPHLVTITGYIDVSGCIRKQ